MVNGKQQVDISGSMLINSKGKVIAERRYKNNSNKYHQHKPGIFVLSPTRTVIYYRLGGLITQLTNHPTNQPHCTQSNQAQWYAYLLLCNLYLI